MKKAFTLIEILIYISIFAVASGLMIGILTAVLRVQQTESSSMEVTGQLNFVMQTISRLVRESSAVIVNDVSNDISNDASLGTVHSRLVLRVKDSGFNPSTDRDPIIIWNDSGTIKMSEGIGQNQKISVLTNNRVVADKLEFSKFVQYPGHDTVSVDIQLTYNSSNPNSRIQRSLRSAIARVSAATFDSNLLPGSDGIYDFGYSPSTRWRNAYFSGDVSINGGLILRSPGGTCYKITISNGGSFTTSTVSCP
ncbi:MAG: hypothetical protein UU85_C0001G0065 [Candidatus Wolfebacteria bacterium GW2011_GWA2_42_10]|uniref:Type II secretion system protein n=2 Tax=Candidatus Wolfeibacteriota TaxID=1752735 RepID=A0A0G0XL65_9BACT|nr:MAG: hypothetical protein UU38_C0003G0131 [Candidatus Wolfebacteria bacterium GW2011_GWB1_41_12]KKS25635.1 MAG: hypothetical protein UU85_C0001G0065 [Candidatus Wolfebacteria bacterium GW2011_GWA2_42_10]KKT56475.1 MAG: hypothetical protein UW50_C0001G0042 [Candidatus Wolfebacteria bacterium GW2011_GWA1_44_24]